MSGQAGVIKILSSMVAGGFSLVLIPGRSAYKTVSGSRWSLIPRAKTWSAQSCLQVYLPCCRASEQLERMWWMVGCLFPHNGHRGSIFSRHRLRLSGVGRVSVPALRRKDSWPAGRPCRTLFHTLFTSSSSATDKILVWTDRPFSLTPWVLTNLSLNSLRH